MSKSLVIVESPAKAKTINKYLGSQYVVKSSVGHICDLPTAGSSTGEKAKPVSTKGLSAEEKTKIKAEKDRAALVKRMGIDPYHDWKANYQIHEQTQYFLFEYPQTINQKALSTLLHILLESKTRGVAPLPLPEHLNKEYTADNKSLLKI